MNKTISIFVQIKQEQGIILQVNYENCFYEYFNKNLYKKKDDILKVLHVPW